MKPPDETLESEGSRQKLIRRNVLLLSALALAFYFGFMYVVYTRTP